MRQRVVTCLAALLVAAPSFVPLPARAATAPSAFVPFGTCTRFLEYVRAQALAHVGPYGLNADQIQFRTKAGLLPTGTTAPATIPASSGARAPVITAAAPVDAAPAPEVAADASFGTAGGSSGTNTQEVNVDEGDLVENDGRHVYSVVDGRLRIIDTGDGQGNAREIASVGLPRGSQQLLLDGKRLAVTTSFIDIGPETIVSLFDVANPAAPRLLGRSHLEGGALAVRTVDHRARIVMQTQFGQRLRFFQPADGSDASVTNAIEANRAVVRKATVADWMPRMFTAGPRGEVTKLRSALTCREVGRPAEASGLAITWVATLDLDVPKPRTDAVGAAGVVGTGAIAYASNRTLYISTSSAPAGGVTVPFIPIPEGGIVPRGGVRPQQTRPMTRLHAFDLGAADGARYLASGSVDGAPLSQFSMSEHGGFVRIATTGADPLGTTTESAIHVLQRTGKSFKEVGTLGGLGRTERIYAVRFVGDLGYVVTFRRTDPLYVVDLRDPRRPGLAGELKIPGYSAYLHPIEGALMLGVGQDATDDGRVTGTQVSLFDINDPYNPQRLTNLKVGGSSVAEYDHHAFLYWPATASVVIPNTQYGFDVANNRPFPPFFGAVVATVSRQAITEKGRINHEFEGNCGPALGPNGPFAAANAFAPIQRSLIVAGQLVTVGNRGLMLNRLDDLSRKGWVPFGVC